ncbi:Tn7-like element transposition protein TnsE [Shewanella xiamenensis]|uniref:Tn7-like element transposition protein TnsE n=1 Tax=Shewanella xiamenensis TaxID=332186 RepID=UPI00214FD04F|nr:Tn7-like element transposition protein TnsE [Shewanella xiamenensis]MCR4534549.1 Tn7-like element transposition protein TnsE [Shewanella xiamenensis]WHF55687.1 Tn7-like element transposition protein TnsE [Shewanella xiamenensis]
MIKIKGFDDDVTIVHIGDFFRYNNVSYWSIGLWCNPVQDKKFTRLANLPLLSRGKQLNGRKTSRRIERVFTFEPGYQLHDCKLSEFPELSTYESVKTKDGLQNAFYFEELWETIVLPQLELARAIFLVNSYLCRSCLSSESLSLEFDVQPVNDDNHVNIHVLKTSTFPKTAFDQSGTKQLLAWLLTDPLALSSYQSIYQHYRSQRQFKGSLESWCFSFAPPPMTNWQLHVRGRYDRSKTHYLIEEIIGIEFDVHMPNSVAFINPAFVKKDKNEEGVRTGSSGVDWKNTDKEFEIDDEQSASDQNETFVLEGDLSWSSFTKPCDVYKQEKVKDGHKLIMDELADKETGREVSTDEPYQGGALPAADVGGKQDITDREIQFASRFKSFDRMLQVLVKKYKCSILQQETQSLPKVGRSKQHLLENGSSRAIKAVRIRHKVAEAVLLEVDTSDGIKMLSTKVIFGLYEQDWIENFIQIRKGVVAKSIAWPNDLLNDLFGESNHMGINHPKHQGAEAGNILVESIESWAQRFVQTFN